MEGARQDIDRLKSNSLRPARAAVATREVGVGDATAVVGRIDADMDELRAQANAIVEQGNIAVLGSGLDGAQFVVSVPDGVDVDAGEVVGELAGRVGGGGGGPPDFARAAVPMRTRLTTRLTTRRRSCELSQTPEPSLVFSPLVLLSAPLLRTVVRLWRNILLERFEYIQGIRLHLLA